MSDPIVSYERLLKLSRKRTATEVRNWLLDNRIPFLGHRRPFTTIGALEHAMGVAPRVAERPTLDI